MDLHLEQLEIVFSEVAEFLWPSDLIVLSIKCNALQTVVHGVIQGHLEGTAKLLDRQMQTILNIPRFDPSKNAAAMMRRAQLITGFAEVFLCRGAFVSGLNKLGPQLNEIYFPIGSRVYLTPLHIAAATGDLQLCRILVTRGAIVNANIHIPKTENRVLHWGLITPSRLAQIFKYPEVCNFFLGVGGILGSEEDADAVDFSEEDSTLIAPISCWISRKSFYPNTIKLLALVSSGRRFETIFEKDLDRSISWLLRTDESKDEYLHSYDPVTVIPGES